MSKRKLDELRDLMTRVARRSADDIAAWRGDHNPVVTNLRNRALGRFDLANDVLEFLRGDAMFLRIQAGEVEEGSHASS